MLLAHYLLVRKRGLVLQSIPSNRSRHEATSNIIYNLSQMGISIRDAYFIEIDTYFELVDLYKKSMSSVEGTREATQSEIDSFLM